MMATTHALAGVVLAVAVTLVAPEAGGIPVLAAALGGLFPDFDLYAGHRKTLHFPVYYSALTVPAALAAVVVPTEVTAAVALFLAAAALHSVMDVAGGGLELKPWLGTSDRAVYDHYNGRWVPPKRWIRYDGAPEDLALATTLAAPAFVAVDGPLQVAVGLAFGVSVVYTLLRKPLVAIAERLVDALPAGVRGYVPDRFVEELR